MLMTVKEMRTKTGLTQRQFAELLEIPYWTLVDWEHERRKPAPYLVKLLDYYLQHEGFYQNSNAANIFIKSTPSELAEHLMSWEK